MFAIIDVPSNLGLRPSGVERLPDALGQAGLQSGLGARNAGAVMPARAYDPMRSAETGLLNGPALRETSLRLAGRVSEVIGCGDIPVVLAGDCSVILGALLGTRLALRSTPGLLFIDGHVDFYQPEASPTGEAADMDLALATGRGPGILAALDGPAPLVREADVVAVGARDGEERKKAGAQDIESSAITVIELEALRERGIAEVANALGRLPRFWCHLDADVLDDEVMPAVDYRQSGGLSAAELTQLLAAAANTKKMIGISVAIYNPALDESGRAARALVGILTGGLQAGMRDSGSDRAVSC
jgi:arginase